MKIGQLVDRAKKRNPDAFVSVEREQAISMVRAVFIELRSCISDKFEGEIKIVGLGTFAIKNVERKNKGNVLLKRRVFFLPVKDRGRRKKNPLP